MAQLLPLKAGLAWLGFMRTLLPGAGQAAKGYDATGERLLNTSVTRTPIAIMFGSVTPAVAPSEAN